MAATPYFNGLAALLSTEGHWGCNSSMNLSPPNSSVNLSPWQHAQGDGDLDSDGATSCPCLGPGATWHSRGQGSCCAAGLLASPPPPPARALASARPRGPRPW